MYFFVWQESEGGIVTDNFNETMYITITLTMKLTVTLTMRLTMRLTINQTMIVTMNPIAVKGLI